MILLLNRFYRATNRNLLVAESPLFAKLTHTSMERGIIYCRHGLLGEVTFSLFALIDPETSELHYIRNYPVLGLKNLERCNISLLPQSEITDKLRDLMAEVDKRYNVGWRRLQLRSFSELDRFRDPMRQDVLAAVDSKTNETVMVLGLRMDGVRIRGRVIGSHNPAGYYDGQEVMLTIYTDSEGELHIVI